MNPTFQRIYEHRRFIGLPDKPHPDRPLPQAAEYHADVRRSSPQAIFISNYGFAESVKDIWNTFYSGDSPEIYTVSPMFTMPENDFQKYELNYRQLGKVAAECLIQDISKEKREKKSGPEEIEEPNQRTGQDRGQDSGHPCLLLENSGFRDWFADILIPSSKSP